MIKNRWFRGLCPALSLLAVGPTAAVVARVYPLAQIIASSDWIASAKVSPSPDRLALTLAPLKGTLPAGRTTLLVAGKAGKDLRERVARGQTMVLFASRARGGVLLGFSEGTWLRGEKAGASWKLTALHPEMARTWTGSSAALVGLVRNVLSGKTTAPLPALKRKPSLGPIIRRQGSPV